MKVSLLKRIYDALPVVHELRQLRESVNRVQSHLAAMAQEAAHRHVLEVLLSATRYQDPKRVTPHEGQVFSQSGEDGILAEIFRRVGVGNRTFAEVGVGDGLENNTVCLLAQGWQGAWVDGNPDSAGRIRATFKREQDAGRLKFREAFVTRENVAGLLTSLDVPKELDLLSLDIDLNTYWIWEALGGYHARVIVVEYNATWPPTVDWKAEYDAKAVWQGSMYFGASLKAFELLGRRLGYALVGCDLGGANAFFVRVDLLGDRFAAPFTAENHYEPARLWLGRRNGHSRAFRA